MHLDHVASSAEAGRDYAPLFGQSLRAPPANIEAEQALLGALLANNRAYERCQFLQPQHFFDPVHQQIFGVIKRRIEDGQVADVITLRSEFENSGVLDQVGGARFLAELLSAMVGIINAGEYATIIRDCWMRREVIEACNMAVARAFNAEVGLDAGEVMEGLRGDLEGIEVHRTADRQMMFIGDAVDAAYERGLRAHQAGGVIGLPTRFRPIDERIGGLEPGTLTVLAARPAMGKTSLAVQIAMRCATDRLDPLTGEVVTPAVGVGVISLEMETTQLGQRVLALVSRVDLTAIRKGDFAADNGMADRVVRARQAVRNLPLLIEDEGQLTAAAIRMRARSMDRKLFQRHKKRLGLLVVDYLQIVGRDPSNRNTEATQIGEITAALRALGKELGIPILVLAQLSREVERRDDKRPQLADLRGSGAIEQDADNVLFLFREEYYVGDKEPPRRDGESRDKYLERVQVWAERRTEVAGKAEVICAKVRQGEGNTTAMLGWDGKRVRFFVEGEG